MANFKDAPISGTYVTMKSVFTALRNDDTLQRYLYYPSKNMDDDPTDESKHPKVPEEQIDELFKPTINVDELEGSMKDKRGRITFGLGSTFKSYTNHKATKPFIHIYIWIPRYGFQDVDFRLEAILDRVQEIVSDKRFTGSFGRLTTDGGNPYDAPKGYLGYVIRYGFSDTDF